MKDKKYIENLIEGIDNHSIKHLSKAITLTESNKPEDIILNQYLIDYYFTKLYNNYESKNNLQGKNENIVSKTSNFCKKIGITGAPGVGKSTFIESFGLELCNSGYRVAVLAIDPSSVVTKGSILGDKTRMNELSNHPNSFIRPSPTSGNLGGVNAKTREAILLCEAAGFDYIIIETVGVGQSEIEVRKLVDFFMLLVLPAGGDDLQGIKKGIVEMSDLILINKADGQNLNQAKITKSEYHSILNMVKPTNSNWDRKIDICSALEKKNLDVVLNLIDEFYENPNVNEYLKQNFVLQNHEWAKSLFLNKIINLGLNFWENQQKIINNVNEHIYQSPIIESNDIFDIFINKLKD